MSALREILFCSAILILFILGVIAGGADARREAEKKFHAQAIDNNCAAYDRLTGEFIWIQTE